MRCKVKSTRSHKANSIRFLGDAFERISFFHLFFSSCMHSTCITMMSSAPEMVDTEIDKMENFTFNVENVSKLRFNNLYAVTSSRHQDGCGVCDIYSVVD